MFNHGNGGKWDDDPNDSRMCVSNLVTPALGQWLVSGPVNGATVSASSHDHFHKKDDSIIVGFGWIWAMFPFFSQFHSYRQIIIYFIYTHIFMHLLAVFYCFSRNKTWGPKPVSFSAEVCGLLQQHSEGQGGDSCDGGETLGDFTCGVSYLWS